MVLYCMDLHTQEHNTAESYHSRKTPMIHLEFLGVITSAAVDIALINLQVATNTCVLTAYMRTLFRIHMYFCVISS